MCALLSCQGLAKAFGAQTLFSDITFVLGPGDKAGLIGPNGSGKSTLLKILCGLEHADQGTIFTQKLIRVSYVPQTDIFEEDASSIDNLLHAVQSMDLEIYPLNLRG